MVGVKVCGIKTDLKNQEANDFSNGWFVFYFLHYYNYFLYFSHYINCLITCFLFLLFLFRYLLYTLLYKEIVNINTICHLFSCCDVQVNPSCTCNKMENTVCMKGFTESQWPSGFPKFRVRVKTLSCKFSMETTEKRYSASSVGYLCLRIGFPVCRCMLVLSCEPFLFFFFFFFLFDTVGQGPCN